MPVAGADLKMLYWVARTAANQCVCWAHVSPTLWVTFRAYSTTVTESGIRRAALGSAHMLRRIPSRRPGNRSSMTSRRSLACLLRPCC